MKKTLFIVVFTLLLISCEQHNTSDSSTIINAEKYNSEEKTELISSYAQMLAASMGNPELRETIKDEAQIKFDGDYDILTNKLQNLKLKGDHTTVRNTLAASCIITRANEGCFTGNLDELIEEIQAEFPNLQVSVPIHCDEWDTENYIPLVAFLPYDFDDQTATEVEAFDINGNSYMLSLEEEPEQPVIVVSISERVDKNGDILAFTNTLSGPYSDLYPNRSNSLGYPTKADTAPTGCKLSPSGSRSLLFEWQNVDNQGYAVFRKTTGDSDFVLCNTTELNYNYFVDNNLTPGQSYYYKVRAILGENHYSPFSYYVGAIASSRDEGERLQVKSIKFADGQALRQVEKWVSGAPELRLRIVKGGENSATIVYDSERFEPKKRSDVVGEWWEIPDNMSLYISNWNSSSLGTVLTFDWQEEDQNGKLTVEIQANYENQFESAGKVSAGGKAQYSTEYGDDHVATVYVTWWDSNKVYSTGGFSWELY